MPQWPTWWKWELELSPHLFRRMVDRGFNEIDLREMPERATEYRADREPDRFVIVTRHAGRTWEVIVEPDAAARLLVVITAYVVA